MVQDSRDALVVEFALRQRLFPAFFIGENAALIVGRATIARKLAS